MPTDARYNKRKGRRMVTTNDEEREKERSKEPRILEAL